MSVPCTALHQSYYVPPTPDELFARVQPVFALDPNGKNRQGALPISADDLIRRQVIEHLSSEQVALLAEEQKELALYRSPSMCSWREERHLSKFDPPQTPILNLINDRVLLVERHLLQQVIAGLSYLDRITLVYHYHNQSMMLEAVRFRSRLFKQVRELCS